jgi:histidinol dehydrogenase
MYRRLKGAQPTMPTYLEQKRTQAATDVSHVRAAETETARENAVERMRQKGNQAVAGASWRRKSLVVKDDEDKAAAALSDEYASEHVHVCTRDCCRIAACPVGIGNRLHDSLLGK